MPRTPAEQAMIERFAKTYAASTSDGMRKIERAVCGCDYGGTSWTTQREALDLCKMMNLGPGMRLLEVGAGSGWPGLYLAKETGCDVALVDLPLDGLRVAKERAAADGLEGACWITLADGAALPFGDGFFDAVFHSDVLCCLVEKAAVLEACRRVVGAGGKMVFSVIMVTPGLTAADTERAQGAGPPFVETPTAYPDMLREAGWEITERADLSAEYLATLRRLLDNEAAFRSELGKALGESQAADVLANRHATRHALEAGLLRRELFSVRPA